MTLASRFRSLNEQVLPKHLLFGPKWLILCVNNHCNLHCRMCDVGTGNGETNFGGNLTGALTRSMPLALFRALVEDLAVTFPGTPIGFAYTEPLAWPHLGAALDLARQHGVPTSVTTNGLLLERHAEMLGRSHTMAVNVSIDGTAAVHDFIRRKDGSHARAVRGIALLRSQPAAPPVTVVCTVSSWNCGNLAEFVSEMAALDLAGLIITHNSFVTPDMAERHNAVHAGTFPATPSNVFASDIAAIDTRVLAAELSRVAALDTPFPVTIQPHLTSEQELERYYAQHHSWIGTRCRDAFRMMMIDSDGVVLPSHGRCYRKPAGRFGESSLRQLWNAGPLAELRGSLNDAGGFLPACARCCSSYG